MKNSSQKNDNKNKFFRSIQIFDITLLVLTFTYINSIFPLSFSSVDGNKIPLDKKISELFKFKENGIFIEVGANNGILQSNTYLLEKNLNWKGLLIEPSPRIFHELCNNRPNSTCFSCALGSFEENGSFVKGDFDDSFLMSSINGERMRRPALTEVPIRSLQSILDETNISHIDLFSLDTEGYEYNILQGIDFSKVTFQYILIEIYKKDFEKIVQFLSQKGYELIENFSLNYLSPTWDGSHEDYLFKKNDH